MRTPSSRGFRILVALAASAPASAQASFNSPIDFEEIVLVGVVLLLAVVAVPGVAALAGAWVGARALRDPERVWPYIACAFAPAALVAGLVALALTLALGASPWFLVGVFGTVSGIGAAWATAFGWTACWIARRRAARG